MGQGSKIIVLACLVLFLHGLTTAYSIVDAEIVDKTDYDEDGYVSDFAVKIQAPRDMNEKGKE